METYRPVGMFGNCMGQTTLTRSKATVASILAAAGDLFIEQSYSEVTMHGIAEACGLTKGALYHHFTSKEELYLAMMHADLAEKRGVFLRAIADGGNCRQRLGRLTRAFFRLPVRKRKLMMLVRRDISFFGEPARSQLIHAYQEALPAVVESVLVAGIKAGELSPADPRLLSWLFVAMVGVTLSGYADSVFPSEDAKLEFVLNLFFNGAAKNKNGANQ